jgi:hypothetical protein
MAIDFYDVKTRQKVSIDEKQITKTTFETKGGQTRYGIRGRTPDGRTLTKFVSKGEWDKLTVPEGR